MGTLRFLVTPVRRDTELRLVVHFVGTDLHFKWFSLRSQHGGVKGLIYAESWGGNIVFEPAWHRVIQGMNRAHCAVAVPHAINQNPNSHEVKNLIEVSARTIIFW